jgi:hypothetical protein
MGMFDDIFGKKKLNKAPDALLAKPSVINTTERGINQGNYIADQAFRQAQDPNTFAAQESYKKFVANQAGMGGALDPETQAMVTRSALEGGAGAGIAGSSAGRGVVARDLGLSSMALQNDRMDRAADLAFGLNPTKEMGIGRGAATDMELSNLAAKNQQNLQNWQVKNYNKNQDSFLTGIAKGMITSGTVGMMDSANSAMSSL